MSFLDFLSASFIAFEIVVVVVVDIAWHLHRIFQTLSSIYVILLHYCSHGIFFASLVSLAMCRIPNICNSNKYVDALIYVVLGNFEAFSIRDAASCLFLSLKRENRTSSFWNCCCCACYCCLEFFRHYLPFNPVPLSQPWHLLHFISFFSHVHSHVQDPKYWQF